jgi:hypothetical protein
MIPDKYIDQYCGEAISKEYYPSRESTLDKESTNIKEDKSKVDIIDLNIKCNADDLIIKCNADDLINSIVVGKTEEEVFQFIQKLELSYGEYTLLERLYEYFKKEIEKYDDSGE